MSASSRLFASLALAAALLLALAPTTSRILAGTGAAAQPLLLALCTSVDDHVVDVAASAAMQEPRQPADAASVDAACDYCALLSPPLPAPTVLVAGMVPATSAAAMGLATPILAWPRNLRGLGSQAPPSAA